MDTYQRSLDDLISKMKLQHEKIKELREQYPDVYEPSSRWGKMHPLVEAAHYELYPLSCEWLRIYDLKRQAIDQVITAEVKAEIRKNKPVEPKLMAVTICPEESDVHTYLFDIIGRIKDEPHILSGKYVLEQRSKGDEPEKGWHLHMVVSTNSAPSKLHQFITQRLRRAPSISAFVVVKPCFNTGWEQHYMRGYKGNDEDKKLKSEKDVILRQKYQLENVYTL